MAQTPLTETNKIGDVVGYEAGESYSRKAVTIASGAGILKTGTVLGKITASGKYLTAETDAVDGSQTAVAVLLDDIDATSADKTAKIVVRHATLKTSGLIYGATVDDSAKKQTKRDELEAVGIVSHQSA